MLAFTGTTHIPSNGKWIRLQESSLSSAQSFSKLRYIHPKQNRVTGPCFTIYLQQQQQQQPRPSISKTATKRTPAVVFVLGGPGSGKGTQCELLKQEFELPQLCVGELLRREASTGTALGESIAATMQRGEIVPGHITMSLLRRELDRLSSSTSCVLIDGFPRAMDQAIQFENEATVCTFVLFFHCEPQVMMQRLRSRAITSERKDDVEDVFLSRLNTFEQKTIPVVEHYRKRGLLREIDAQNGDPEQVFLRTRPLFVELFQQLSSNRQET